MFTGIVEEVGIIDEIKRGEHSAILTIRAKKILEDIKVGDSIAVNGICLTVTSFSSSYFKADVMHETLNRSSLLNIKNKSKVNLERAMLMNGRFGGHIVSGHIDGVGKIDEITADDTAILYKIKTDSSIMKYIIEKGSVAVDGISLTVAKIFSDSFLISAIPHTVKETVLSEKVKGDFVNIENDMIGKYVEKMMEFKNNESYKTNSLKSNITKEFLSKYGY